MVVRKSKRLEKNAAAGWREKSGDGAISSTSAACRNDQVEREGKTAERKERGEVDEMIEQTGVPSESFSSKISIIISSSSSCSSIMVRILNGEIVADDDPRIKNAQPAPAAP